MINRLIYRIITSVRITIRPAEHDECVIFGSGPSLDMLNSSSEFLKNKDLIGCNYVHQNNNLSGKKFTFYSMIDRDYTKAIDSSYFSNLHCDNFIMASKNAYLAPTKVLLFHKPIILKTQRFNPDSDMVIEEMMSGRCFLNGNSMPFLIQVAAILGKYKKIYLYGVDHYSGEDLKGENNYAEYHGRVVKSAPVTKEKLDYINSFYAFIKSSFQDKGILIYNITPNSKLTIFQNLSVQGLTRTKP
jgi:hypothetical protein